MTYSEYTIIECSNLFDLVEQVNAMIEDGWQPLGGVVIIKEVHFTSHYQTMVR